MFNYLARLLAVGISVSLMVLFATLVKYPNVTIISYLLIGVVMIKLILFINVLGTNSREKLEINMHLE